MTIKVAYFEITNVCNLNCRTCYNRSGLNSQRLEISAQQLRQAIQELLTHGLKRVLISGGEPALHSDFDSILDLLGEFPELSFGFVTNGTVYNQKFIDAVNSNDHCTLQISLDGSCEEQNAKTRGIGNFEKTLAFARQIHKPMDSLLMKMVVSQNNYEDIENFYRLAVSVGFLAEYAFIYRSGNGSDGWEDKCLSDRQKLDAVRTIDRLNKELGVTAMLPDCTFGCPFEEGIEELSICIKTNGDIQPCQTLYSSEYTVGDIFDFNVTLFSKNMERIHNLAVKRTLCDYGCDRCIFRGNCKRGCMATAVNLNNDPLASDGDCGFRVLRFLGFQIKDKIGFGADRNG